MKPTLRVVTRVFDLRQRETVNVQLACNHVVRDLPRPIVAGQEIACPFCTPTPDAPPEPVVQFRILNHRESCCLFLGSLLKTARILGITQNESGQFTVFYVE